MDTPERRTRKRRSADYGGDLSVAGQDFGQWLHIALDSLRVEMTDQHQRLRSDMNAGFMTTREEWKAIAKEISALSIDVATIRAQREAEEKEAMRRSVLAGTVAGGLFTVLIKLADWLWNR